MKERKILSFFFAFNIIFFIAGCLVTGVSRPDVSGDMAVLIAKANRLISNEYYTMQVRSGPLSIINPGRPWVTAEEMSVFKQAIAQSETPDQLENAILVFKDAIKADGSNPYFRGNPGVGQQYLTAAVSNGAWSGIRPADSRVPADYDGSTWEMIAYPFADNGTDKLLKINYNYKAASTFGGVAIQTALTPAVTLTDGDHIEFDVYYPRNAQGKFMRWRVGFGGPTTDGYMRDETYNYRNLNPEWIGSLPGSDDVWLRFSHIITVPSTGAVTSLNLELHGETSRPAETGVVMVGNVRVTKLDQTQEPLSMAINTQSNMEAAPLRGKYNKANGLFMIGALGTGHVAANSTRGRHYEIFVNGNNLKPQPTHNSAPNWLHNISGESIGGGRENGIAEYTLQTDEYLDIRDSGRNGEYKSHAHVLAWYNQSPQWMTQMIPATLRQGYNGTRAFYGLGNSVPAQTHRVSKETARRVQYNHIMYVMRHFLTTGDKYGSSASRGVIPFHSWDVLNEEIHESRHSEIIPNNPNEWRTALKHTNWLVAMTDNEYDDIYSHYIYLLFKYAHMAAPNARMIENIRANLNNRDVIPEYMTVDGHLNNLDSLNFAAPPILVYNDYGIASYSKAKTTCNMIRDLNTAWKNDPLYDGRNLIEDMGIQGHDTLSPTLASDSQIAIAMYADLIDQSLLNSISYSELDIRMPASAPGGGSLAPAQLNVKQSDALGYQYALLYKMFTKWAKYIDHIISWGIAGSGWQGSYVLFDNSNPPRANSGYYGVMNPDMFITGHPYLDSFFAGEYEKLQPGYKPVY